MAIHHTHFLCGPFSFEGYYLPGNFDVGFGFGWEGSLVFEIRAGGWTMRWSYVE